MAKKIEVSVIIPTYNGAEKVVKALYSLSQQATMPDEVVVVIDGSTDNTKALIKAQQYGFKKLTLIEQENKGRAAVRNRGAAEASGELLLFLDDDMLAPENWISAHIAHHQIHKNTILTGRLEDPNQGKSDDFLNFKAWLNQKWNKGLSNESGEEDHVLTYSYLTANNCSIERDLFFRLNGFDGRLKDAEDYDLAVRAQDAGISIYFGYKAYALHNDVTNCYKYIKRLRQYQQAQQVLVDLKPDMYQGRQRYYSVAPKGLKGLFFSFFCRKQFVLAIDKGYFKCLPKEIRYRLYDYIVTANGAFFPNKVTLD